MLINDIPRNFNSVFHFHFDRNENFVCRVFFNYIEFLKHFSEFPEIYEEENFKNSIRKLINFSFSLQDENQNTISFDVVEEEELFSSDSLICFYLLKNKNSLEGKYKVYCNIGFEDGILNYSYLQNSTLPNTEELYQYKIYIEKLNLILERKNLIEYKQYTKQRTYNFESDYIDFSRIDYKISNLGRNYQRLVSYSVLKNTIEQAEQLKNRKYIDSFPVISFVNNSIEKELVYDVRNKTGNVEDYLELSLGIIKDNKQKSYIDVDFLRNIHKESVRRKRDLTVKDYEIFSPLQSSACENEMFIERAEEVREDSELLYIAFFVQNFNIIPELYWAESPSILPAYVFDVVNKFNLYLLKNINEDSLAETWMKLTKENLESIPSGKYLCMFSCEEPKIQKNLIENYFILVR